MALKFFIVPIQDPEAVEAELNEFLASHKILSIERQWVAQGADSFWAICVDYREKGSQTSQQGRQRNRVDYRQKLNQDDFILYAKLRDMRKEIGTAEGVPLYNIFNNNQLAEMIQKKARSKQDLEAIVGVGDARVEKYGQRFLDFMAKQWGEADETSEPAVSASD